MNNVIDNYFTAIEKFKSFNDSMVISIGLFMIIMTIVIGVENLLHKVESKLFVLNSPDYLANKLLFLLIELIIINLIFIFLGWLLFSNIVKSYYYFYQIALILNFVFTLFKFSLKLFYFVRAKL